MTQGFKVWIIQAGTLRHVSKDFSIMQVPESEELMVMLGNGAEDFIKEIVAETSLPMPEIVYGTRGLAAADPEWDGQSEYVCEGCGEAESADDRVAYNIFKRSQAGDEEETE
jgi:hypothetical protein